MLVGFIESYVQANQTITQIESLLGRVCRLTPFASQCVVFVDTYTPLIVQYIQANEGTFFNDACTLIEFFKSNLIFLRSSFFCWCQTPRPCASRSVSAALRRPSVRLLLSSSTERPCPSNSKVHLFQQSRVKTASCETLFWLLCILVATTSPAWHGHGRERPKGVMA